jgi:hypothetical protein
LVATAADTVRVGVGVVVVVGVPSLLAGAVAAGGAGAVVVADVVVVADAGAVAVVVADVAGVGAGLVTGAVPMAPEASAGVIAGPQSTSVAAIGASSAASFGGSARRDIKRK